MRTTSVDSAAPADEGCVIAFPRQKTISTLSSPQQSTASGLFAFAPSGQDNVDPGSRPGLSDQQADREGDLAQNGVRPGQSASCPQLANPVDVQEMAGSQMFFSLGERKTRQVGLAPSMSGSIGPSNDQAYALVAADQVSCAVEIGPQVRENTGGSGRMSGMSPEAVRKAAVARLVSVHNRGGDGTGTSDLAAALAVMQDQPGHDQRARSMTTSDPVAPPLPISETSHYIAQMARELAQMARGSRLDLLAYFLDMAEIEARMHSSAGVKQA